MNSLSVKAPCLYRGHLSVEAPCPLKTKICLEPWPHCPPSCATVYIIHTFTQDLFSTVMVFVLILHKIVVMLNPSSPVKLRVVYRYERCNILVVSPQIYNHQLWGHMPYVTHFYNFEKKNSTPTHIFKMLSHLSLKINKLYKYIK